MSMCLFMCAMSKNAKNNPPTKYFGLHCAYICNNFLYIFLCIHTCQSNKTAPGHLCTCKPALMYLLFSRNASVHGLTGEGNGYGDGSSVRCCTIRLVPFPLIGLTLSHLACDTSNAGAFLRHLIDQNKHIIL